MSQKKNESDIDLRRLRREFRRHRVVTVAGGLLIFGLAVAYSIYKEPEYTAYASMLIEDADSEPQGRGGSLLQMMRVFNTGGFASSSVDNELLLVNTFDVTLSTVRRAGLNVVCRVSDGFGKRTLTEPPVRLVTDPGVADTLTKGFKVRVGLAPDGKADIKAWRGSVFRTTLAEEHGVSLPCHVSTRYGGFTVVPVRKPEVSEEECIFSVTGYFPAAMDLYDRIKCDVSDKMADGIDFEYTGPNRERARTVLEAMMGAYNDKRLARKRETAQTELDFLTERINSLSGELLESEKNVEKFKNERKFVDIEKEAPVLLETTMDASAELLKSQTQLAFYKQVAEMLESGSEGMLPDIPLWGEDGSSSSSPVSDYNTQVGLLMELRRSAKPGNLALSRAEDRVKEMRASILTSFRQTIAGLQKIVEARSGVVGAMSSHLHGLPSAEREYINLSRDQLLKNELYAFLVEKRENALMKLQSSQTLGYIIDPAYVELKPSKKKKLIIAGAGLLAAIAAAAIFLTWSLRRRKTVDDCFDLAAQGLEDRCTQGETDVARSRVMESLDSGVIYMTGLGDWEATGEKFEASLAKTGTAVSTVSPEKCIDELLGEPMQNKIKQELKASRYVLARVKDGGRTGTLSSVINREGAVALLIVPAGTVAATAVRDAVRGIDPRHLVIYITGNDEK